MTTLAFILLAIALLLSAITNVWMWRINKLARSALVKLTRSVTELTEKPVVATVQHPKRILIAGNRHEAEFYMRECEMNPRQVIIPNGLERLRGLGPVDVVYCGTWWTRPDIIALKDWVRMQRALGLVLSEFELPEKIIRPSHA